MNIYIISYTKEMTKFIKNQSSNKFLKMKLIDKFFRQNLQKLYDEYGYLDENLINLASQKSILEIS